MAPEGSERRWRIWLRRIKVLVQALRRLARGELDEIAGRAQSVEAGLNRAQDALAKDLPRQAQRVDGMEKATAELRGQFGEQIERLEQAAVHRDEQRGQQIATLEAAQTNQARRVEALETGQAKHARMAAALEQTAAQLETRVGRQAEALDRFKQSIDAELTKQADALERMRARFDQEIAAERDRRQAAEDRLDAQSRDQAKLLKALDSDLHNRVARQNEQINDFKNKLHARAVRQDEQFKALRGKVDTELSGHGDLLKQTRHRLETRITEQEQRTKEIRAKLETRISRQTEQLNQFKQRLQSQASADEGLIEFDRLWGHLERYVDVDDPALQRRIQQSRKALRGIGDVRDRVLNALCEKGEVRFRDARLRYINPKALWTVIREILINEEYYFEHPDAAPRIIDGGSNFGLSLYYFKHLYPEARIVGFEPAEDLCQMAQENVQRNQWRDVEVLPYALSDEDDEQVFFNAVQDRLGGSLTERKRRMGDEVAEHRVQCRRLSPFLKEPVDLLKLDIEGAERQVLPEIREHLPNVRHLICEYHVDPQAQPEQLGQTIAMLEQSGFFVHVDKSDSFGRSTVNRPMDAVDQPVSLVIWAKNREAPSEAPVQRRARRPARQ